MRANEGTPDAALSLRRATVGDVSALTELSLRSKAHWGYDAAFMEMIRPSFIISAHYIQNWPVYLIEKGSKPIAFYGFRRIDDEMFLADMFVDPVHIERGIGKRLWDHALQTARAEGYSTFLIESDPNAEGFYTHMGATRIGDTRSPASGRVLPLMKVTIEPLLAQIR